MLLLKLVIFSLVFHEAVEVSGSQIRGCSVTDVYCICGTPPNERIHVFEVQREILKELANDCSPDAVVEKVCLSHSCWSGSSDMKFNEVSDRRGNLIPVRSSTFPVKFVISPDEATGLRHKESRFRRFPKTCNDSLVSIKNTIVSCWAWPDYLTCEFMCGHGYALREGGRVLQKTTRNCREAEHFWRPTPKFPVCEPFIHCEVFLATPGNLTCKAEHTKPAYCEISCFPYEEHDATPLKRYECLDGKYAASLPHCASVNKTVPLIERPRQYASR